MSTLSRASRARRIALKAVYGGGGLGLVGAAVIALLIGQIKLARRTVPRNVLTPPACSGRYGSECDAAPIRLAVLGDSTGVGLGAETAHDTPGAILAQGLSDVLQRPVDLDCVAVAGSQSQHLNIQVDQALAQQPQIALIFIGANDVIGRIRPVVAVRHLDRAVRRLREHNVEVVVATCPDIAQTQSVRPPLRWLVRRWCRELAAAQTVAVVTAGGRTVSLADMLGNAFAQRPTELFAIDGFHPSAAGYRLAAETILPSVLAALGYEPTLAPAPSTPWSAPSVLRQGVRSLPRAAAEAASTPGTEVSPVASAEHARRGLWGELRNRLAWLTPKELVFQRTGSINGSDKGGSGS